MITFLVLANTLEFGLTVAIVGFSIVLLALAALVVVFIRLPKIINFNPKKYFSKNNKNLESTKEDYFIEGNVTAAIGLALHLYFSELHDEESNVVTIKKVRKAYSPWSSKIYSTHGNWPR